MQVSIRKMGNSQGILMHKPILKQLGLVDVADLQVNGKRKQSFNCRAPTVAAHVWEGKSGLFGGINWTRQITTYSTLAFIPSLCQTKSLTRIYQSRACWKNYLSMAF